MDTSQRIPRKSDTTLFTASKGWLHRTSNRLGLKDINVTGEAAPVAEEAMATFPAELKFARVQYHPQCQASTGSHGMYPPWIRRELHIKP